jgi:thymidylate synthase
MVQAYALLAIMAHLTGLKPGTVCHRSVNCHIYEDQYKVLMKEGELKRFPFPAPRFHISKDLKTLEQLEQITPERFDEWFSVSGYQHHDPIKYPFSV